MAQEYKFEFDIKINAKMLTTFLNNDFKMIILKS